MSAATSAAVAVTFVWLGMVLAISFLEAPLKFRAPQVTLPIGLGIGRLVFRALNSVELVLAVVVVVASLTRSHDWATVLLLLAVLVLVAQLLLVRPRLTRRSDQVLSGDDAGRSQAHIGYVVLESLKVTLLLAGGILLLAGSS
ncbi:MAG TPA: hypothetical protein VGK78_02460 [Nocardioides sp.]|uniref:hypothetical protein n=1 Tax=Nocardioides sp. TaxID=35761 RepID=UPI002F40A859